MVGSTKSAVETETKLKRIAQISQQKPGTEFKWLMPHFNSSALAACFHELDGRKASGIDGKTKVQYGQDLTSNLEELISRMKTMSYRPAPVREVLIPKEGSTGEMRPLGISNIEDKVVQSMAAKILDAIYEPTFRECSYGFRPDRNCHMAIKALSTFLHRQNCQSILDVDLKNYFGSINHEHLIAMLKHRIKDKVFIRYIVRMLKAGVLRDGELEMTEEGSPQGSIVSPVLSNVFAHYVIDSWFEDVVRPRCAGQVLLVRYCDDLVICCELSRDAIRIRKALEGRLQKFSLELNAEKTKMVSFCKRQCERGIKQGTFDFLGFTFYIGKTRKGNHTAKLKTSRKRLKSKLKKVKAWLRRVRNAAPMSTLWGTFRRKLAGHMQYYGVSFNSRSVSIFFLRATRLFYCWMNRRSQKRSFNWEKFTLFLKRFPLPRQRVLVPLF